MATRTSTRSTKAVKFVEEEEEEFGEPTTTTEAATTDANATPIRVKNEPKKGKSRGRPRRQRGSDDEDWDAANEQSEEEEEEEDEDEDDERETEQTPKKYKGNAGNRAGGESVYDFGEMPGASPRKWTKTVTPQRTSAVPDTSKSGEKLMCSYCNYTTTKKYLLQRHLKSHSTERPHKCAYCDRSFKTTIQLTNHVNTHLGVKPFQCKFCSFSFTTSGELIRHVRYKHTLEKPHRCDECGYATVELSKLRRHIRTHTGEKPYACPHCSYCSPDTFKLKRHLRVHTGERPYQCTICNFRFTQSNSLKAHMLTHQAEKPSFPCSYCPSVMARKSDLRYHIGKQHARQSEPLPQNKSDEDYSHRGHANTSQQLDDQTPKHRGTRPFQCSECGLMFAARADLRAHVTRTHRNLSSTPTTTNVAAATRRPQRRAASLQHRYIGTSSGAEDEDPTHPSQQQDEDDYRCPICHRQFTSARLLDRHTYAVHEPKHDSYDERDYHQQETLPLEEEDDVRDYADDELEEKNPIVLPKAPTMNHLEEGLIGDADEDDEQQALIDEEEFDLAPNVEDILDEDEETFNEPISTIKSISSANRKQLGIVRKFEDLEQDPNENLSNKRKCSINRNTYKSMVDEKSDFDVFGFDG